MAQMNNEYNRSELNALRVSGLKVLLCFSPKTIIPSLSRTKRGSTGLLWKLPMFSFIPFPWTIFSVSHAVKNCVAAGCTGAGPSPYNLHSVHTSPISLWLKCKHFVATDAGGSVSALRGTIFAFNQPYSRCRENDSSICGTLRIFLFI